MSDDTLPDNLRKFVIRYLDSVAHLETLLLLRASPQVKWDIEAVARRLYTSKAQASDVLRRLQADGLLSQDGDGYVYGQHSSEISEQIEKLAVAYTRHLIPITNLIHDKPRRIREFADAFKIKKEP